MSEQDSVSSRLIYEDDVKAYILTKGATAPSWLKSELEKRYEVELYDDPESGFFKAQQGKRIFQATESGPWIYPGLLWEIKHDPDD